MKSNSLSSYRNMPVTCGCRGTCTSLWAWLAFRPIALIMINKSIIYKLCKNH